MTRFTYIAIILLVGSSLQAQAQTNLSMENVNGWSFFGIMPEPWGWYDSSNTGMAIIPKQGDPTDSVQLFQMYANTMRFVNEWTVSFSWLRRVLTAPQFIRPKYVLLDIQTRSYVNLQDLRIGIAFADTITHVLSFTWNTPELRPDWYTFKINTENMMAQYVHDMELQFFLYAPDSTYIGLEILCNNMRFVYPNGDTLLVDPFQYTFPSGIVEELPGVPTGFVLHQNYPNPFNPTTNIRYEIQEPGNVKLSVFSLLGEKITDLVDQYQSAGIYEAEFSPKSLASGTYIYILQTGKFSLKKKMSFIK